MTSLKIRVLHEGLWYLLDESQYQIDQKTNCVKILTTHCTSTEGRLLSHGDMNNISVRVEYDCCSNSKPIKSITIPWYRRMEKNHYKTS